MSGFCSTTRFLNKLRYSAGLSAFDRRAVDSSERNVSPTWSRRLNNLALVTFKSSHLLISYCVFILLSRLDLYSNCISVLHCDFLCLLFKRKDSLQVLLQRRHLSATNSSSQFTFPIRVSVSSVSKLKTFVGFHLTTIFPQFQSANLYAFNFAQAFLKVLFNVSKGLIQRSWRR